MKASLLSLVAFCATPAAAQTQSSAAPLQTVDAARLEAARRLIDTILPPETRDATFAQMITAQLGSLTRGIVQGQGLEKIFADHPEAGAVFARFVDRQRQLALEDLRRATPALMEAQAAAYARRFTVDEMTSVRNFYASPTGRKYRVESLAVLTDPAVLQWQSDVAARSQARLKPELSKLMAELKPIIEGKEETGRVPHS